MKWVYRFNVFVVGAVSCSHQSAPVATDSHAAPGSAGFSHMKLRINVTVHIVWYMYPKRSSGFNPDKIWIQMIVEEDYK